MKGINNLWDYRMRCSFRRKPSLHPSIGTVYRTTSRGDWFLIWRVVEDGIPKDWFQRQTSPEPRLREPTPSYRFRGGEGRGCALQEDSWGLFANHPGRVNLAGVERGELIQDMRGGFFDHLLNLRDFFRSFCLRGCMAFLISRSSSSMETGLKT